MLTVIEKVIFLQNVDVFSDVPAEQLSYLAAIATEVSFDQGATIYQVNQNSDSMYGVLEGRIRLHRGDIEIGIVEPKGAMGAWALMDDEPRVANAEVVEDAKLLRIDKDDFIDLLSDHVEITQGLLRTLTKRLHGLAGRVGFERRGDED
ncbi:MAG TPA: Crp/Fnr family transcriptional regulator [candidate division Zixibacteria bacterium]|jgi:CRP-like cAMP-binding protein|nr:Crp/Fnr family transcriptional regulator [Candidatus Latescibacterota bacterium]HIG46017.1 Crp/Fnr family transcriptional regulator [candidate division Zixibacteria bacterium]